MGENEGRFKGEGYLIPRASRRKNDNHYCLTNYALDSTRKSKLRMLCNTNTEEEIIAFRKQFYKSLREEIETFNGRYVILSNEHCYKQLEQSSEIVRLKQLFDGLYDEIKIIIYIREQSDMLCSRYSTTVKNNNKKKIASIEEYSVLDYLNYNQKLKEWEDVFGIENIILRIFDRKKLYQNDVISDFCKVLGIHRYEFKPTFLNISLNVKQCEFLRIVNMHIPDLKNKKGMRIRQQLNTMVHNTRIESPPISVLINKKYQSVYDGSNRELAIRYHGHEIELFNKKPLISFSQDQAVLLTDQDKKNLAEQIISNNEKMFPGLCKWIAAIFDVNFRGKIIPIEYAQNFRVEEVDKEKSTFRIVLRKIYKRLKTSMAN